MSNYHELKERAAELLRQAEELRSSERNYALQSAKELISEWNFTVSELGLKPAKIDKRVKVSPKYRDPSTGSSWSGRGVMPKWMAAQLDAGASKEQFLIAA